MFPLRASFFAAIEYFVFVPTKCRFQSTTQLVKQIGKSSKGELGLLPSSTCLLKILRFGFEVPHGFHLAFMCNHSLAKQVNSVNSAFYQFLLWDFGANVTN